MANFSGLNATYDEDCDLIEICEHYHNVYKVCEKGALLGSKRCSPAEKMLIKLLVRIDNKLSEVLDELKK